MPGPAAQRVRIVDGIRLLGACRPSHASEPDSRPPPVSFSPPKARRSRAAGADVDVGDAAVAAAGGRQEGLGARLRLVVKIDETGPAAPRSASRWPSSSSLYFIDVQDRREGLVLDDGGVVAEAGDDGRQHEVAGRSIAAASLPRCRRRPWPGRWRRGRCPPPSLLLSGPIRLAGSVGSPIFFSPFVGGDQLGQHVGA